MFDFEIVTLGHPGVTIRYFVTSFFTCFLVRMKNLLPCSEGAKDLKQEFHHAVVSVCKFLLSLSHMISKKRNLLKFKKK